MKAASSRLKKRYVVGGAAAPAAGVIVVRSWPVASATGRPLVSVVPPTALIIVLRDMSAMEYLATLFQKGLRK